jgi:xanthine dehydrogenase small subunit
LALRLSVVDGVIAGASVGVGGVAATPARARHTEQALASQPFNEASLDHAGQVLASEFTPLSDMRASAAYRRALLHKLMRRAALEWSGMALPHMDELKAADLETLA